MLRRRNILTCLAVVAVWSAGAALGKAVRQDLTSAHPESRAGGHAILNCAEGADKTNIQVNCWGLEPTTVYTVLIYDDDEEAGTYDLIGAFTTTKNGKGHWHGCVEGDVSSWFAVVLKDEDTTVQLLFVGVEPWGPGIGPVPITPPPSPCLLLQGTGNIIPDMSPAGYACTYPAHATADVDNDPTTGHWDDGNWSPNETHIAIARVRGDLEVNPPSDRGRVFFRYCGYACGESDCETQTGELLIQFIDATRPDWDKDEPETWCPKRIDQVTLQVQHDGVRNYVDYGDGLVPNPDACIRIKAYNPYVGLAATYRVGDEAIQRWVPVTVHAGQYGMSELRVYTDFAESGIDDLSLFLCAPLVWTAPRADLPSLSGALTSDD